MKIGALIGLWLVSALLQAAEKHRGPTSAEVEGWEEFAEAPMTKLKEIPPAKFSNQLAPLSEEFRAKGEVAFRRITKALEIPLTGEVLWTHHVFSTNIHHRDANGYISATFVPENPAVTSVYLKGFPSLGEVEKMVTPELFEAHGAAIHQKIFGHLPLGRVSFHWGGEGIRRFDKGKNERAVWALPVGDAFMAMGAGFSAERRANHEWVVSCSRGPTIEERRALEEALQANPTVITPRGAIAIAWKHWKAVRDEKFENGNYQFSAMLHEIGFRAPFNVSSGRASEQRSWRNAENKPIPEEGAIYTVSISAGLFGVNLAIDRIDGRVYRMDQGQLPW